MNTLHSPIAPRGRVRAPQTARQQGFSLAELMVVIVIIGLLVTIVVPNVLQKLNVAQGGTAKATIAAISGALDEYAVANGGNYPESLEELVTPDENGYTYLKARRVPLDPWRQEFQYDPPSGSERRARVYTLGRDGSPGGTGDNADIDNWDDNDD